LVKRSIATECKQKGHECHGCPKPDEFLLDRRERRILFAEGLQQSPQGQHHYHRTGVATGAAISNPSPSWRWALLAGLEIMVPCRISPACAPILAAIGRIRPITEQSGNDVGQRLYFRETPH